MNKSKYTESKTREWVVNILREILIGLDDSKIYIKEVLKDLNDFKNKK